MTVLSFASYCGLCLVQGAIVLLPRAIRSSRLAALRARWPLVAVPAAAVTGVTFLPQVASLLAVGLSSLALALVPPLAALGIAWALRWRDWRLVPLVPALFAAAWATPGSPAGKGAALLLVSSSCVALAAVVVAIVPNVVAKVGIVLWAAADLSLALVHGLEQASRAITQAAPAVGPLRSAHLQQLQLQRVVLGPASMEYADLFVAALFGAVLAAQGRQRGSASLLIAALSMSLAAFLLVTNVIPATVPVAVALTLEELRFRRGRHARVRIRHPSAIVRMGDHRDEIGLVHSRQEAGGPILRRADARADAPG